MTDHETRDTRTERMGAGAVAGDAPARPHALTLVRATANITPDLTFGEEVLVDATDPDIQDLLRTQLLIPLPAYRQPPQDHVK